MVFSAWNLSKGQLALVLHAHLPYVRSIEPGSLEEDWFFEALMESYIPLIELLDKAFKAEDQSPRLTVSISPTLLSLFSDEELTHRFPSWLSSRLDLLVDLPENQKTAAAYLVHRIENQLKLWDFFNRDLISQFSRLQKANVLDLLTCAATHGYLPLLRDQPEAIRGQLNTAVKEHARLLGVSPLGIWLPECAYYEGLDRAMQEAGLRYAVLDGHGLLHAIPRPRYGLYAPICTPNGVAFFGRDSDSTLPVWSATEGYPGDPVYREFHRDLGWDLSPQKLKSLGLEDPRPLGIKFHRVTGQDTRLDQKAFYDRALAISRVKEHARCYLKDRRKQLDELENTMRSSPLLVAPFDAELFGHWWFEGPIFLSELFKQAHSEDVQFVRLLDVLLAKPRLQLCNPCPSSWGQGGFHNYWLNEANSWIVPQWSKASQVMVECCNLYADQISKERLLKQAARELLLAQSSDWSFILRSGTTTELAKNRIDKHLNRFWTLIDVIKGEKNFSESFLSSVEQEDSLFPFISPRDWSSKVIK